MTTHLITGVAGFIGSNLAQRLLDRGFRILGVDRKSSNDRLIRPLLSNNNFDYYNDWEDIKNEHIDMVWHLAASADIRYSAKFPERDADGIMLTYELLSWMRSIPVNKIAYASSAAMYGDIGEVISPIPETCPIPVQTSFYGASKLACEGLIQAHCLAYNAQSWIFRFASILGEHYSHGFVYNFYRNLKSNPNILHVAGSPEQRKSYLYVQDCIDAMLLAIDQTDRPINIFNVGHPSTISLPESIPVIIKFMGIDPKIEWSGERVGWIGDSFCCDLDVTRLQNLGWNPTLTIPEAIEKTLVWLEENPWILERGEI